MAVSSASGEQKGRCISCGYLAKCPLPGADRAPLTAYYEFEQVNRELGRASQHVQEGLVGGIPTRAVCLKQIPIEQEIAEEMGSGIEEASKRVFLKERNCNEWMLYTPGFSPKEHLVEEKVLYLEELRKANEQGLFEISRKVQEGSLEIARQTKAINRYAFWANLILGLAVLVVASIQTILTTIALFPEVRAWLTGLFR